MSSKVEIPEIKEIKDTRFARIDGTNAWYDCDIIGKPIFDRGEVEAAKKVWEAFPDFEVRVTIGPYRFYDVKYKANWKKKLIIIDFYSVRPGTEYIPSIIEEMKNKKAEYEKKLQLKTLRKEYIQLRLAGESPPFKGRISEIGEEVLALTAGNQAEQAMLQIKWEKAVQRRLKKVFWVNYEKSR